MVYRMIDELEKKSGRLSGAALIHRDLITNTLADRWAHKLPDGQRIPDIHQLQTFISEDLDELNQEVLRVERQLRSELTDDRRKREARDRSRTRLRELMLSARKIFDAIYGPGGSDVMFQEQNSFVRSDPVSLYRQAVALHANLLDPDFARPPLRLDVGVDLEKLARQMEPDLEELGTALEELRRGTQDSIEVLAAKDRHMERLERKIGVSARLLESLYAYADHQGIAIRVRPPSHRSSRNGGGGTARTGSTTVRPRRHRRASRWRRRSRQRAEQRQPEGESPLLARRSRPRRGRPTPELTWAGAGLSRSGRGCARPSGRDGPRRDHSPRRTRSADTSPHHCS